MYQSWSTSRFLLNYEQLDRSQFKRNWGKIFDSEIVLACKSSGNQGLADADITSDITPPTKKNIYIYINISHSFYLHGGHPQISTSLMRIHSEIRLQNIAYIITISNIIFTVKIFWLANRLLLNWNMEVIEPKS
jgi:hypothetical protein